MALWFIPVIAIPCLWPAYALYVGEFDLWINGIAAQGNRRVEQGQNKLLYSFGTLYQNRSTFHNAWCCWISICSSKKRVLAFDVGNSISHLFLFY